jgi:hypothetical protein
MKIYKEKFNVSSEGPSSGVTETKGLRSKRQISPYILYFHAVASLMKARSFHWHYQVPTLAQIVQDYITENKIAFSHQGCRNHRCNRCTLCLLHLQLSGCNAGAEDLTQTDYICKFLVSICIDLC